MENPPFFYKVSFHFLAQEKNKEIVHQNWQKEFYHSNPLISRKEAFEVFEEYLQFLKDSNRVEKDEFGNYNIISPSGVPEEPSISGKSLNERIKSFSEYSQFREDLDVLIVINNEDFAEELTGGDSTIPIHTVSSQYFNRQSMLDNLWAVEKELYLKTGFDIEKEIVSIQHFGEDFAESGEVEGDAYYNILPTPFQWTNREQYEKRKREVEPLEVDNEQNILENIIAGGETNTLELKSSLAFNFSENSANWKPLFNNAKTIAGFLNSNGGFLVIGVKDDGTPEGIEKDHELLGNKDKIRLKVDDLMSTYFNNTVASLIDVSFEIVKEKELLVIAVKPSKTPIFLKMYNSRNDISSKHFFVRRSASTTEIKDVEEIINYVYNQW